MISFLDSVRANIRVQMRAPIGLWKRWIQKQSTPGDELAICAIFKEEAPYLDEWLRFHTGIGTTHFFLYNNFSTDNFRAVLQPWIQQGLVTLIEWPVPAGQLAAYADCLRRYRNHARWIAFIDVDEFLFSPQCVDIRPILSSFADLPGLEVWNLFFGSSGHLKRPDGSVIASYIRRSSEDRTTVKTIANPRMVYKHNVHQFKYWLGVGMDTSRRVVDARSTPVFDLLRINHYWSRSIEDLEIKIRRGDPSTLTPRQREWHLDFEQRLNKITDLTIQPVAKEISKSTL